MTSNDDDLYFCTLHCTPRFSQQASKGHEIQNEPCVDAIIPALAAVLSRIVNSLRDMRHKLENSINHIFSRHKLTGKVQSRWVEAWRPRSFGLR
jgi:hypothetical protein